MERVISIVTLRYWTERPPVLLYFVIAKSSKPELEIQIVDEALRELRTMHSS